MPEWQTIAVLVCLVFAGHFLVRRLLKASRGGETNGCGTCPSNASLPATKPLVPLDVPDERPHDAKETSPSE